jgi:hypothetical protein
MTRFEATNDYGLHDLINSYIIANMPTGIEVCSVMPAPDPGVWGLDIHPLGFRAAIWPNNIELTGGQLVKEGLSFEIKPRDDLPILNDGFNSEVWFGNWTSPDQGCSAAGWNGEWPGGFSVLGQSFYARGGFDLTLHGTIRWVQTDPNDVTIGRVEVVVNSFDIGGFFINFGNTPPLVDAIFESFIELAALDEMEKVIGKNVEDQLNFFMNQPGIKDTIALYAATQNAFNLD